MAGSGGKRGRLGLPSNGCLRYLVLYLIALVLLIAGVIGTSGGLLSNLGLPSTNNGNETTLTLDSNTDSATGELAPNSGGSEPEASGQIQSLSVAGSPLNSNQAGLITPYLSPAFYIVQSGDTLEGIAGNYATTAQAIQSYNRLPNSTIFPGQVLYLPPGAFQPVPGTGRNSGNNDQP